MSQEKTGVSPASVAPTQQCRTLDAPVLMMATNSHSRTDLEITMQNLMRFFTWLGDKAGALGALVSAMGCSMCFPAIASLGAALGLGFLDQWEGLFLETLMPAFAWLALGVNALGWLSHRQWYRSLLGMLGPTILLLSLYPWFQYAWSSYATYAGIGIMIAVSIWDLLSPASRRCADGVCETAKT
jgi:mercuric ion transport protein